jgi:hypothetical protein
MPQNKYFARCQLEGVKGGDENMAVARNSYNNGIKEFEGRELE